MFLCSLTSQLWVENTQKIRVPFLQRTHTIGIICKILMQSHNRQRVWYFAFLSFLMQYTVEFSGTHAALQPLRTVNWATVFRSHIYPRSLQTCFRWHELPFAHSVNVLNPHQQERILEWKNNREKCIAFVRLMADDSPVPVHMGLLDPWGHILCLYRVLFLGQGRWGWEIQQRSEVFMELKFQNYRS